MYAIRSYYGIWMCDLARILSTTAKGTHLSVMLRITSYNVCYTKLLRDRGLEPLVGVTTMVGGQIAHQAHAPGMGSFCQSSHGLVAAEQRIDFAKGGGVIAVIRFGREERRQVDGTHPERLEVIQVRGDAVQIATEVLPRRVRAFADHGIIPLRGLGPGRSRPIP